MNMGNSAGKTNRKEELFEATGLLTSHTMEQLAEMSEKGDRMATLALAHQYRLGDEENGIFVDLDRAAELYALRGETLEEWHEEAPDDPTSAILTIDGPREEIDEVESLIDMLAARYGTPDKELGLYVPAPILVKALVGSDYYRGNILFMEKLSETRVQLKVEMNHPHVLAYALRYAFTGLNVEWKYTDF